MPAPFTIQLFATTGDPAGIRIVEKSNWSGVGVAFPRHALADVVKEDHAERPGIYILVGDAAEETIYIGEADPVGVRLRQHLQKDWSWGVFFVDSKGLGKTEIQFLESELIRLAREYKSSILMNRNVPTLPSISRQQRASAEVFLQEILLILPMIGIRAFSKPSAAQNLEGQVQVQTTEKRPWDTIVVPAVAEGFHSTFIGKNCWFAIRINPAYIKDFRYLAAYQVAPISAVTHVAEIDEIVPYEDSGKYLVRFKGPAREIPPIPYQAGKVGTQPQSPRYTYFDKLAKAKFVDELW